MELREIRRKRAKLIGEARTINDLAISESRVMTPEEQTRFDALIAESEQLREDIERCERLESLERSLTDSGGERGGSMLPHNEPRNLGKYSLLRAIRCMADRQPLDGLEEEVSDELAKRRLGSTSRKLPANGFIMPPDLPIDQRAAARGRRMYGTAEQRAGFDTGAGSGGIPTILSTDYIQLLRNKLVIMLAGATLLSDMTGNFAIPKQTAASTMTWVGEGGSPPGSQPTVLQVPFTPKTASAFTDITRRLSEQLNVDAEQFVRADLTAVVARGIDAAALTGTGLANEPLGLFPNPAVQVVPIGVNGGAPTWAMVVGLETAVAIGNADEGALAYVTNARVRGALKTTPKVPNYPTFLWNENNPDTPVNGYPAYVSNQVPNNFTKGTASGTCSGMAFGNWADCVIATWSGLDVIVDPYTGSSSGTLRIVVLQDVDVNFKHTESFAKCVDLTTIP